MEGTIIADICQGSIRTLSVQLADKKLPPAVRIFMFAHDLPNEEILEKIKEQLQYGNESLVGKEV